jgi:GR25 family glycosyltransferase involved in LPS biosynthesis
MFHAKVAGCVPIYWGDKFVDRDFDSKGFLNANTVQTPEDLRALIERLEADPAAWRRMAEVPALSEYKRHWCERVMEEIAKKTVKRVLGKEIQFSKGAWDKAVEFHATHKETAGPAAATAISEIPTQRRIITAANAKFVPSARLFVQSVRRWEKDTPIRVYVWPDVSAEDRQLIAAGGAEIVEFPTKAPGSAPWEGYWEPEHFAWKLWIHAKEAKEGAAGTAVLYLDSAIDIVAPLDRIWNQIAREDMCLIEDHHPNSRWCHPTFCQRLGVTAEEAASLQLWAGCVGFRVGGKWSVLHEEALRWAAEKDVICGKKWEPYTDVCRGHRHDQSILSVLSHRLRIPRLPLDARDIYCDKSRRTAENWGCSLYVHRGNPQIIQRLIEGIDEAYVINLERRRDRLETFKKNPHLKDLAYVWRATDGKTLQLTPELARLFSNNDFKWKKAVMGCALSHFELWQKLATDPVANSYLIMEDDVKFREDWAAVWKQAAPSIPTDADVIYLGGVLPPNQAAFPSVTEPVNAHFARVAKNSLFSAGQPRRYFHFCNYAYVMTKAGAQKMMQLIQQRGIFTSGDHMIVNHGDGLFNIYFTTPLIASCIQENDPVYQKSDFNNFARLDSFDSDLWNNNEHFSQEEVVAALAVDLRKIDIKVVNEPMSEETKRKLEEEHAKKMAEAPAVTQQPSVTVATTAATAATAATATPQPQTKEEKLAIWNGFLRAIAKNQTTDATTGLERIFALWNTPTAIVGDMSWFRIFEQLILTSNPEMAKQKERILAFIEQHSYWNESVWKAILKHWGADGDKRSNQSVVALNTSQIPTLRRTPIWVQKDVDFKDFWEIEWLQFLFPNGIEWREYEFVGDVGKDDPLPVIMYFNPSGKCMAKALEVVMDHYSEQGKQAILLHISDEFASNNIGIYDHPAVKAVFRNYWRPGLNNKVTVLPLGYAKGRSATGLPTTLTFEERPLLWSFAGSLDREGRVETLNMLHKIQPSRIASMNRWGDKLALQPREYCDMLRQTKFVPCLRGAKALESFRFYEALEHGGIPVYVPTESHQCADEMRAMYGNDLPFIAIPVWSEASNILPKLASNPAVMEEHRQKVMAWWSAKKAAVRESIKAALSV